MSGGHRDEESRDHHRQPPERRPETAGIRRAHAWHSTCNATRLVDGTRGRQPNVWTSVWAAGDRPSRLEATAIGVALSAAAVLRVVYAVHYRVDSDEPQHLHVAWGWSQGLMQYRDVFDNHAPLFHILFSPLVRAVGERPELF